MSGGFETYSEDANKLVVQRHWGATTVVIVTRATQELVDRLNETAAERNLNLVSETEVDFAPAALIQSVEALKKAAPTLQRLAYVLDRDRHSLEEMVIATVAWDLDLKVGFFDNEDDARAFLLE